MKKKTSNNPYSHIRNMWNRNPITKVVESKKVYKRHQNKKIMREENNEQI